MLTCIQRLSSVLQWNPDDVEVRTRRALLSFRLRSLKDARDDLDLAIKTSKQASLVQLPNLDSGSEGTYIVIFETISLLASSNDHRSWTGKSVLAICDALKE